MFEDILRYLVLRRANYARVDAILKKENFFYTPQIVASLLYGNQQGVRYGNIVLERNENGQIQKRFLKIMLDGTLHTYKLFCRQIKITNAFHKDEKMTSPTMCIVKSSLDFGVPYSIFETREDGEGFGFMHDNETFYEKFTEQDMYKLVETIYSFHKAGADIDKKIWKYTQEISSDLNHYKKQILGDLNQKITHKSKNGETAEKHVGELLATYLRFQNIKERVLTILEENWKYVVSSKLRKGYFLVHADMQIDNIYKHKDGAFELLDFEWVGKSDNPVIAIMYDYGNLRARAWSSPSFQNTLDKIMLEVGTKYYGKDIANAGIILGRLRSSLTISRFHLDFKNTVIDAKRTEEEYQSMYPKIITVLKEILAI